MNQMMEVDEKLKSVFAELFEISPDIINENSKQNELPGWDSLGQLRIIMAVEEAFEIQFMIEDIPQLNTFGKLLDAVKSKSGI